PRGRAIARLPHGRPQLDPGGGGRSPGHAVPGADARARPGALGSSVRRVLHDLEAPWGALLPRHLFHGHRQSTGGLRARGHDLRPSEPRAPPAGYPRGRPPPGALPLDAPARPNHRGLELHVGQGAVRAVPDQLGSAPGRDRREHVRGEGRRRVSLGHPMGKSVARSPLLGAVPGRRGRLGSARGRPGHPGPPPRGGGPRLPAAPLPLIAGMALGHSLRESHQRRHTQRLLDLQSEEIIYSNRELEKKFAELETRIEQLSLLTDLSAAVSGTLDPERIYDQTLSRLVHLMRYEKAYLFVVDRESHVLSRHRM